MTVKVGGGGGRHGGPLAMWIRPWIHLMFYLTQFPVEEPLYHEIFYMKNSRDVCGLTSETIHQSGLTYQR